MHRQKDIEKIASQYDIKDRVFKLHEEFGEFTQAIHHHLDGKDKLDHVTEEIADVEILLAEIKLILKIDNKEWKDKKIDRQLKRINKW